MVDVDPEVATAAQPMKRTFKKFSFRVVDLDALLDSLLMSLSSSSLHVLAIASSLPLSCQIKRSNLASCKIPLGKMVKIDEPLYPIAVLIDELKNEDIQLRLNSIRRLSTIARALRKERTRKELIPFLSENNDDDDEVLLAMAGELGVFIPYVGSLEYANVLLPPPDTLCMVEETCVREKSVESLCRIGAQMREHGVVEYFIPLFKRLAAGEWLLARVSSCGLFHIAYSSAPEALKTELRTIYRQLCENDKPMVRRSAATNLGKLLLLLKLLI